MTQYQPPHINRKLNVQAWWLTALLISINVGLFIWQIISGVDISDPAIKDALHWGADFTPLTFSGQPERLFTSMFFHFGIIHLMLNMWALYIFALYTTNFTEPLSYQGSAFLKLPKFP
ncbi:hypothetical protein MASRES_GEN12905_01310 [Acinetobacter baumannii]